MTWWSTKNNLYKLGKRSVKFSNKNEGIRQWRNLELYCTGCKHTVHPYQEGGGDKWYTWMWSHSSKLQVFTMTWNEFCHQRGGKFGRVPKLNIMGSGALQKEGIGQQYQQRGWKYWIQKGGWSVTTGMIYEEAHNWWKDESEKIKTVVQQEI